MNIAFDARVVQDHYPGISRYAVSLLDAVAEALPQSEISAFYVAQAPRREDTLAPLRARPNIRLIPAPRIRAPQGQLTMRRLIGQSGANVVHSPYFIAPFLSPAPLVITIHDLIPLTHAGMVPQGGGRWLYPWLNRLAARRATHLLAVSSSVAADARRLLGVPPHKLTVVAEAPAPHFRPAPPAAVAAVRARHGLGEAPYLLHVGINKPHKNQARLLQAFAATRPAYHGTRLVLAGPIDPRWPHPADLAREAGVSQQVHVLGPIPDADLPPLYSGARAFIFPSLAEGFGLPLLEAMACGAPCAVSEVAPLTEWTVNGTAALLFDPLNVSAMRKALERLIASNDLAQALRAQGLARAADFTWPRAARRVIEVYRQVVERR